MGPLVPALGAGALGIAALLLARKKSTSGGVSVLPQPSVIPGGTTPAPSPAAPAAPIPASPASPGLPVLNFAADMRPMTDASAYYVDPQTGLHAKIDVHAEAQALRFLGYNAPVDPGGGNGLNSDRSAGAGSFNAQLQAATAQFQTDAGITSDGWIGPQTIGMLSQAVSGRNGDNQAQNQSQGVPNATFAGIRFGEDPIFARRRARQRALRHML